ncbi:hypothetical protein ES703_44043 [subsurface metagenome]
MKQVTRWKPDTCSCVLDIEWDDEEPEGSHTIKAVPHRCEAHQGTNEDVFKDVLSENTRKNKVFGLAQELLPALEVEDYDWHFDAQRILEVKLKNLGSARRAQLQKNCNSKFGTNLVKVN